MKISRIGVSQLDIPLEQAHVPTGLLRASRARVPSMIEYRDTAYGRVPLPAGIRSRMEANGNGLRVHFLEAGFEDRDRTMCAARWRRRCPSCPTR